MNLTQYLSTWGYSTEQLNNMTDAEKQQCYNDIAEDAEHDKRGEPEPDNGLYAIEEEVESMK